MQRRGLRRARPARVALGLGGRRRSDQGAFHRFGHRLAATVGSDALLLTFARLAPHPFTCREPRTPRQRTCGSLQTTPLRTPSPRRERRGAKAGGRRRCVAPMSATDLRHEHPASCPIPSLFTRSGPLARALLHEGSGRASLDGDPPASGGWPSIFTAASGGRGDGDDRALLGPGGCCDQQPLRQRPPPAA
jgi:hypothetical protein